MKPEHEEFLLGHVKKMGFVFIVDALKAKFPDLNHKEACGIYDEFRAKNANNELVKNASSALKQIGEKVVGDIQKALNSTKN